MALVAPLLIGVVTGVLSGLLGVGGGMIIIPALVLWLGTTQHLAQGVSLAVIVPTALAGLVNFHRKGLVSYSMAGWLTAGSIAGILLSSNFVHLVPPLMLKKLFGVFLIIVGLRMFFSKDVTDCQQRIEQEMEDNGEK